MKVEPFNPKSETAYDYVVVGAGITGATIAASLAKHGHTVAVLEQRNHVAGNCYTKNQQGIDVHKYGAHIFRTEDKCIWDFVNSFHPFHPFVHKVLVNHKGKLYSFPINFMTLQQIYGDVIKTPYDAYAKLKEVTEIECRKYPEPKNLEEQALCLIGRELYETFIRGYTEKQWGRECTSLPADIIKRIPVRFLADDNYFASDKIYQGIPDRGGYTKLVENMLTHENITVFKGVGKDDWKHVLYVHKIFYTGALDELFDYDLGYLQWRSLRFEESTKLQDFYQPTPVVNYADANVLYTRIIEHKQFDMLGNQSNPTTIITKEFPATWEPGDEKYYPVNTPENNMLQNSYRDKLYRTYPDVIPVGRLAQYKYFDMDVAIANALDQVARHLQCGC